MQRSPQNRYSLLGALAALFAVRGGVSLGQLNEVQRVGLAAAPAYRPSRARIAPSSGAKKRRQKPQRKPLKRSKAARALRRYGHSKC